MASLHTSKLSLTNYLPARVDELIFKNLHVTSFIWQRRFVKYEICSSSFSAKKNLH